MPGGAPPGAFRREARALLKEEIALTGGSDTPILAWAHRELGRVLFDNPEEAEKILRIAIDLYERSEQFVEVSVTSGELGNLLAAHGDADAGCDPYRAGVASLQPSA